MIRTARRQRKRARRNAPRRQWLPGEWLTRLKARQGLVHRGKVIKPGWILEGYLAAILVCRIENQVFHCLFVGRPGQSWDGPSYASRYSRSRIGRVFGRLMSRLVGVRRLIGILVGSFFHDHFKEGYRVYIVPHNMLDAIRKLFASADHNKELIEQALAELEPLELTGFGIPEQARVYSLLMEQWPVPEETISARKSLRQRIGLYIFQPWYRLFAGDPDVDWSEYEPTQES